MSMISGLPHRASRPLYGLQYSVSGGTSGSTCHACDRRDTPLSESCPAGCVYGSHAVHGMDARMQGDGISGSTCRACAWATRVTGSGGFRGRSHVSLLREACFVPVIDTVILQHHRRLLPRLQCTDGMLAGLSNCVQINRQRIDRELPAAVVLLRLDLVTRRQSRWLTPSSCSGDQVTGAPACRPRRASR